MKKITFLLCVLMIMSSCKNKHVVANDPVPVYDSLMVASKIINEDRRINVWLPPMYKQTMDSFPVVYMPDGGITEDFPHIANTIAKLISEKQIPPFILVGIENTDRNEGFNGTNLQLLMIYNIFLIQEEQTILETLLKVNFFQL